MSANNIVTIHALTVTVTALTIFLLFSSKPSKPIFLQTYMVGLAMNFVLNIVLKKIFWKCPKPNIDATVYNAKINLINSNSNKNSDNTNGNIRFSEIGMPNETSQMLFYNIYVFMVFFSYFYDYVYDYDYDYDYSGYGLLWLLLLLLLTFVTLSFVWWTKDGSVLQIAFGAMIGTIVGIIFYLFAKRRMVISIKPKPDDDTAKHVSDNLI
jgi:hypothetical protein